MMPKSVKRFSDNIMLKRILGDTMPNLGAPTQVMFLVSLALVVLAIVSLFVINIPIISMYGFWVAVAGYAVLAAACLLPKM
jgi:hypothetical protein